MPEHIRITRNRREFITDAFCGFGSLALASMLKGTTMNPLAAKIPPKPAKAKAVIFVFMAGGPSHLETFDPKPLLNKLDGQKRPAEFGEAKYQFITSDPRLMGVKRTFRKYGQSGIEVSDLLPHIAECVDDISLIRSCHGDMVVHSAAQYQLSRGVSCRVSRAWGPGCCMGWVRKAIHSRPMWSCPIRMGRSKRVSQCMEMVSFQRFTSRPCSVPAQSRS